MLCCPLLRDWRLQLLDAALPFRLPLPSTSHLKQWSMAQMPPLQSLTVKEVHA